METASRGGRNNQTKGISCIILAGIGFSLMTFFVRFSGDLPTMQKAFFRNAVVLVIAAGTLLSKREKFVITKAYGPDIFFRCLFGTTAVIANFYAIDKLVLADSNMLNKLSPFFAIVLSIPLLREKPSRTDIIATLIAFIGALFIIRPTGSNMALVPSLAGLYGGFGAGTAYVFVRRATGKGAKTPVIVICFSLFSCLLTLPFMLTHFVPMSAAQWLMLVLAGASAALGQFSITSAYKFTPAKNLSVFDYTQVLFATLWGFLFLHEMPLPSSIVGYVLIIGVAFVRWNKARGGKIGERMKEQGNPWTGISLDDYEKHMSLSSVNQLQTMNAMMKGQFEAYPVTSAMVLGVAGGNGLEHVRPEKYTAVYGIDINEQYLAAAAERHADLAGILQCLCVDVANECEKLPASELVIANLLIEYIGYPAFQKVIRQVKPEYVSCAIQINRDEAQWVSDSPYLHAFDRLDEVHHQMEEQALTDAMRGIGYARILREAFPLPNGKELLRLDFEHKNEEE